MRTTRGWKFRRLDKIFRLHSIASFANDVHIGVELEQRPQTFAHEPLVVDQQNPNRLELRHSSAPTANARLAVDRE